MFDALYFKEVIGNLGIAISKENNKEFLYKLPILYRKTTKKYVQNNKYTFSYNELGSFIADFLNVDFTDVAQFISFFNSYHLLILDNKRLKEFMHKEEYTVDEYNVFIEIVMKEHSKKLIKLQSDIDMVLDYCIYSPNKNTKDLTPFERLCVLECIDGSPHILYSNKIEVLTLNAFSNDGNYDEEHLCDLIKKSDTSIYASTIFLPKDLSSLIYFELVEVLKNNILLKNCRLCSKYFIANSTKNEYCNNIAPDYSNKKTCKQVGRNITLADNIKKDEALSLYKKVYSNKMYKVSRYKDIPALYKKYFTDLRAFQKEGKIKLKKYKEKKLSKKEFISWVEKNS